VASAKALKGQLEKLSAKIKTRQTELADLKTKQKDLKSQLAEAKMAAKPK
jgi:predicted  nucleic acid-binding Zn-ribbon protein